MKKIKANQDIALVALKKAHSHLSGVIKMLEDGKYCIDVMQQNLAVIGLLKSAHQTLMESHLKGCFAEALDTCKLGTKEEMVGEILKVTKLANK